MIRILTYCLLTIILLGTSIFSNQNQQLVSLKFLNYESIDLALGLVLVLSAGVGAIFITILQSLPQPVAPQYKTAPRYQAQSPQEKTRDFDDEFEEDW